MSGDAAYVPEGHRLGDHLSEEGIHSVLLEQLGQEVLPDSVLLAQAGVVHLELLVVPFEVVDERDLRGFARLRLRFGPGRGTRV